MAVPISTALLLGLAFALAPGLDSALSRTAKRDTPSPEAWAATVVNRISETDRRSGASGPGGTVALRLRIAADGTLTDAVTEGDTGSPALDARALQAVRAAAPFAPPPRRIVTLEGFTELGFALEFGGPQR